MLYSTRVIVVSVEYSIPTADHSRTATGRKAEPGQTSSIREQTELPKSRGPAVVPDRSDMESVSTGLVGGAANALTRPDTGEQE